MLERSRSCARRPAEKSNIVIRAKTRATVSLRGNGRDPLRGDGWTLTLKPGWKIAPGKRAGDSTLVREGGQR